MGTKKAYVIVVGVDYSDTGTAALDKALELASDKDNAEIHLVNLLATSLEQVPEISVEEESQRLALYAEEQLTRFHEQAGKRPERCVSHVIRGAAAEGIVQFASDLEAELIVVGTHGRRGLRRFLLGSVAEGVIRLAECPVLVVRPKSAATLPSLHR